MLYFCLILLSLNACVWYFYHRTRAVPAVPPPIKNEPPPDSVPEYVTKEFFQDTLSRMHSLLCQKIQALQDHSDEAAVSILNVLERTLNPQPIKPNSKNHGIGFQPQNINKKSKAKAG